MGADRHKDWQGTAISVLDWWREAGVDTLVGDEPHDWLAVTRPPAPTLAKPEAVAETLPATLADFTAWRCGPDVPEADWTTPMIASAGDPAADLMFVADFPGEDGILDGAAGRLFDRMLAAIGRSRDTIYLASLAVARPMGARVPPEDEARLAELLRHHIALAAPKRLILLGQTPSRAILGTSGASPPNSLHAVNLNGVTVQTVASQHPRFLLERPQMKAQAWRDLQLVMGGLP